MPRVSGLKFIFFYLKRLDFSTYKIIMFCLIFSIKGLVIIKGRVTKFTGQDSKVIFVIFGQNLEIFIL